MLSFFINNNRILVKLFQKKARITIYFFLKNSKNNNIILGFSFMYLVSVYPMNRTIFAENWKLHNRELCKVRASKFRGRTVTLIWHYSLQCSYHFWQTSLVFYNYRPRQGTPYHNGLKSIMKEHFYLPKDLQFFSNIIQ